MAKKKIIYGYKAFYNGYCVGWTPGDNREYAERFFKNIPLPVIILRSTINYGDCATDYKK
jgi:hypothetical protein